MALMIGLLAACGGGSGGSSRQAACEHVCSCLDFSDPNDGSDCVIECTAGSTSTDVELMSQECIDCAARASCDGILDGTACAVECDDPSS
jgi:hypothetical protein